MKVGQRLWSREELLLTINLYCKLPFGKMHANNPAIKELANMIGRTPSSVAYKLVNFASFDPALQARGIKGAGNASKLDKQLWTEFNNNWDKALIESEIVLAKKKNTSIEVLNEVTSSNTFKEGLMETKLVQTRINQSIFRKMILASYNYTCCMTKIDKSELLIASHISPWKDDTKNRLNPMNGLCLNALHDKAFDKYLITVSAADYTIYISERLRSKENIDSLEMNFWKLHKQAINLPTKFLPGVEFLKKHNEVFSSVN